RSADPRSCRNAPQASTYKRSLARRFTRHRLTVAGDEDGWRRCRQPSHGVARVRPVCHTHLLAGARAREKPHNAAMKTVAVIGASSNRGKYGNKALRAFERQGF